MAKKQKKPGAPKGPKKLEQASREYRLISRDSEKMPVELSQEEREAAGHRLAELVREKEALNDEKREVMREWRLKLAEKQDLIDDCAAGVIKGAMPTLFTVETRAVYKTRMIERVRTQDGLVIEKRAMTPEEEVEYLQPALTGTAPTASGDELATGPLILDEDEAEGTDSGDYLDEDTRAALGGLPAGWRKRWVDARWRVESYDTPLCGADLWEVYMRLPVGQGVTLEALFERCSTLAHLSLDHIHRALHVLRRGGLVRLDEGLWFVASEAPPVETEPGRSDPLPEAAAPVKPKRRRAKDTGEALLNNALDQSEAMEAVH
jgi:hypothetical protein